MQLLSQLIECQSLALPWRRIGTAREVRRDVTEKREAEKKRKASYHPVWGAIVYE